MRPLLPLAVAALVVFAAGADAAWAPIANPRSLVVRQIANFAVIVYSNANPHRILQLELVRVERGYTQPARVGGDTLTDYRLVLAVRNKATGGTGLYQCVVRGKPGSRSQTWKLLSFTKANL